MKEVKSEKIGRHKFIKNAAVVGGVAAASTWAFPMVSRAKTKEVDY